MKTATISFESRIISKGRITIPDDIREKLKLKEGQSIRFSGTLELVEHVKNLKEDHSG